jgi:hypothetical protein
MAFSLRLYVCARSYSGSMIRYRKDDALTFDLVANDDIGYQGTA